VRREDLEHIIRAAGALLETDTVIIIGSQAILASYGEGELPSAATRSLEVDVLPLSDPDGTKADSIDGAMGEFSRFQESFGIFADGVSEDTAIFPNGWRERLIPYCNVNTNGVTGLCVEKHDLCVAKLVAHREKDLDFIRALLQSNVLDRDVLMARLDETEVSQEQRAVIEAFIGRNT